MPKLYEYFGLTLFFYANEHLPIHVHGRYQDQESKAEIIVADGRVKEIIIKEIEGKRPLHGPKLNDFRDIVEVRAEQIVLKWIEFFVKNQRIESERITKRVRRS